MNELSPTSSKFQNCVAVIGLGYAGLPLAVGFGQHVKTIGFDIDPARISQLRQGNDRNNELSPEQIIAGGVYYSSDATDLAQANIFIVVVPTPVDVEKQPDLRYLLDASRIVGEALRTRFQMDGVQELEPIVIFESSVYPGCTEEICIPALEKESGLKAGRNFRVGYSPERFNPGDSLHGVTEVVKIVSAQDAATLDRIADLYGLLVKAGIYRAPDIVTAEATKLVENVQRDVNIALMNEMALLFHRIGVESHEVLKAMQTKWNSLPFGPGLVGGECIPVNPYYLMHKAASVSFDPAIVRASRSINAWMGNFVADQVTELVEKSIANVKRADILVLGVTFKEDVPDLRGSLVMDIVDQLKKYGANVFVYDPVADPLKLIEASMNVVEDPFVSSKSYDAVIIAVPHKGFIKLPNETFIKLLAKENGARVMADVRGKLDWDSNNYDGVSYWRL